MVYNDVVKPARTGTDEAKHGSGVVLTPGIPDNQYQPIVAGKTKPVAEYESRLTDRFDSIDYYHRPASNSLIEVLMQPNVGGDDWTITPSISAFSNNGANLCGRSSGTIREFGVRFPTTPIISSGTANDGCKVTLTAQLNNSNTVCRVRIYGVLDTAPVAPTSYAEVIALPKTTSYVDWVVPAITAGQTYDTPELKTIMQELIDNSVMGGGSMILLFNNNSSDFFSDRAFESKNSVSGLPILTFRYTNGI